VGGDCVLIVGTRMPVEPGAGGHNSIHATGGEKGKTSEKKIPKKFVKANCNRKAGKRAGNAALKKQGREDRGKPKKT